jgi:hypothetical protein
VLSNDDIARFFIDAPVNIQGNRSLREPQREAHAAAADYFSGGGHRAVERYRSAAARPASSPSCRSASPAGASWSSRRT